VRLVLEVLKREKFYTCKSKSSFAQKKIRYLGHIVDKQGIRPNPKKVEAVQTWPVPENVHDVRSFLGLVNYFRKFIDHYSEIAVPLTNLTRKANAWNWTGRCQDAFELLKQKLIEAPLLCTPDERLPYEVVTDASDLGLVLLQDGHSVAFESRKLNSAELNYNVTEKEMLAVVHALHVWRCYLEGALTLQCILIMSQTPISRRNQTCLDGKHAGRSFCSALGLSSGSIAKERVT
jgi:hypothetical protein